MIVKDYISLLPKVFCSSSLIQTEASCISTINNPNKFALIWLTCMHKTTQSQKITLQYMKYLIHHLTKKLHEFVTK